MAQGRKAERITLTERQEVALKKIASTRIAEHRYHQRATIILRAAREEPNKLISNEMNINREFVGRWRRRWAQNKENLSKLKTEEEDKAYLEGLLKVLSDFPRSGHPIKFTAEQVCQIVAVACTVNASKS